MNLEQFASRGLKAQLTLDALLPPKKRKPSVKRMHMIDAGCNDCEGKPYTAKFKCARCGLVSKWQTCETIKEVRQGIPCPNCNP